MGRVLALQQEGRGDADQYRHQMRNQGRFDVASRPAPLANAAQRSSDNACSSFCGAIAPLLLCGRVCNTNAEKMRCESDDLFAEPVLRLIGLCAHQPSIAKPSCIYLPNSSCVALSSGRDLLKQRRSPTVAEQKNAGVFGVSSQSSQISSRSSNNGFS